MPLYGSGYKGCVLDRLIARLRRYLGVDVCRVLARNIDPASARQSSRFEFRTLSRAELLHLCADPAYQLSATWVRSALARGDVCFGALEKGSVAGYLWLAYSAARYNDKVWVRTDPASRYTYKVFIRPQHRGRGLVQELYRRSDGAALARGRTRAVMVVQADNQASLRAARRDGFSIVGYAGHLASRGGALAFRSPGARRIGFEFYSVQAPRALLTWQSTVAAILAAFILACAGGPPVLAADHTFDLAWEAGCALMALVGFALRFAAAGFGVRFPLHAANLVIVLSVLVDMRSAALLLVSALAYSLTCDPPRLPKRAVARIGRRAFSIRDAIRDEHRNLFAIVAVFTAIEIGHEIATHGVPVLDPVWQAVLALSVGLYLAGIGLAARLSIPRTRGNPSRRAIDA
jgi:ribosomal protein S18 acetylase RimI-like enzyme